MSSSTTHCCLTPAHPLGTPANIRIYLIFIETRIFDLHYVADVWVYLHRPISDVSRCSFTQFSLEIHHSHVRPAVVYSHSVTFRDCAETLPGC